MLATVLLAQFIFAGGELILIASLLLILFGAKALPRVPRRLKRGLDAFLDATNDVAGDAGQSIGGIYGKRAAQALTVDNETAELYNPAAFQRHSRRPHSKSLVMTFMVVWRRGCKWLRALRRGR